MTEPCSLLLQEGGVSVSLPCSFSARLLLINVQASNRSPTWHRAGYLQPFINFGGDRLAVGNRLPLGFDRQIIEVPYAAYELDFFPVSWLLGISITINQLSAEEINQIMPTYSGGSTQNFSDLPITDSQPLSLTAAPFNPATPGNSYIALPPDPTRNRYAVTNIGTANVHLDLDPPTAVNKRYITITPGSTYRNDELYQGAVYVWSSSAVAQQIEVRNFVST